MALRDRMILDWTRTALTSAGVRIRPVFRYLQKWAEPAHLSALSTLLLVLVTWMYVKETRKLVELQLVPSIECSFDGSSVVLSNLGSQAVVNVHINLEHYIFTDPTRNAFVRLGRSLDKSGWWTVAELQPGLHARSTDLSQYILSDLEATRVTLAKQAHQAGTGSEFPLFSVVIFDVRYQRPIDRKAYRLSKPAWVVSESRTGTVVLLEQLPIVDTLPPLQELLRRQTIQ